MKNKRILAFFILAIIVLATLGGCSAKSEAIKNSEEIIKVLFNCPDPSITGIVVDEQAQTEFYEKLTPYLSADYSEKFLEKYAFQNLYLSINTGGKSTVKEIKSVEKDKAITSTVLVECSNGEEKTQVTLVVNMNIDDGGKICFYNPPADMKEYYNGIGSIEQ